MVRSILAVAMVFVLGCATPESESFVADGDVAGTQLDSLWRRYEVAAVAGDVEAVAALYAERATVIESGLPTIQGRDHLRSIAAQLFGSVRIIESNIRPQSTELDGALALQHGEYRDVVQVAGEAVQHTHGRFAAVLERDAAAAWRIRSLVAVLDSAIEQQPRPASR